MTMGRVMAVCLGCELFPLFRLRQGRGMALLVLAALSAKHFLYQFLPVTAHYAGLMNIAVFVSLLYVVLSLFSRRERIQTGIAPVWHSGHSLLQKLGMSDRQTHLVAEPVLAAILALVLIAPILSGIEFERRSSLDTLLQKQLPPPKLGPREAVPAEVVLEPFIPWWESLGLVQGKYPCKNKLILLLRENQHRQRMGARAYKNNYAQVLSRPVRWRMGQGEAVVWSIFLPFLAWLGFALHAKYVDWPASPEYRAMQRAEAMEKAQSNGTLTFTSVEEIHHG